MRTKRVKLNLCKIYSWNFLFQNVSFDSRECLQVGINCIYTSCDWQDEKIWRQKFDSPFPLHTIWTISTNLFCCNWPNCKHYQQQIWFETVWNSFWNGRTRFEKCEIEKIENYLWKDGECDFNIDCLILHRNMFHGIVLERNLHTHKRYASRRDRCSS